MGASVWLALGSTLVLMALHLLAPRIRRLPFVPEAATASFAGGIAVAYVVLHLLPQLSAGSREISDLLGDHFEPTPLTELALFAIALAGFLLYYLLERLAERHRDGRRSPQRRRSVFALHVGFLVVYNAVIAYTLPTNWRLDTWFALLFTVAMGLHFVLSDRGLEENYGDQFDRALPRLVLAGGLFVGWTLGALFAPTRTVVVASLVAFLAGGILLNVFKEEIPSARRSHVGWFTFGLVLYAALLALVTVAERSGEADGGGEEAGPVLAIAAVRA